MTDTTDRFEKQAVLNAPRERVWQAISQPEQFGYWFGVELEGPFEPGKRVSSTIVPTRVDPEIAKSQEPYRGVAFDFDVQSVEPEKLLSFRWHPGAVDPNIDYSKEPTTLVEFKLEDASGGTRLTIAESGFDQLPASRRAEAYAENAGGWQEQLKLIAKYLELTK